MEFIELPLGELYALIGLPLLIFFARVCDVSLGTIRIIFISKGIKYLAPVVGFFEILIWIMAISQIMQNLSNIYYYLFYASGFAMGNFVGIILDEKLSIGNVGIRIITRHDANKLVNALKQSKFGITVLDAEGPKGQVKIIFSVVKRQNVPKVVELVKNFNPQAFYSVEDIRFVSETLPASIQPWYKNNLQLFKNHRKGK
ncbi:MAG: DUF2179 domain-containing protein [Thermoplasmatota archaeon]